MFAIDDSDTIAVCDRMVEVPIFIVHWPKIFAVNLSIMCISGICTPAMCTLAVACLISSGVDYQRYACPLLTRVISIVVRRTQRRRASRGLIGAWHECYSPLVSIVVCSKVFGILVSYSVISRHIRSI